MDWITQAALGALIGEWMLGKKLGKQAMGWGALLGIFPDVDLIVSWPFSTAFQLALRQSFTHSVWLLPFMAFCMGHGLEKLWLRHGVSRMQATGFALVVMAGHVLLDWATPDGVALLWPFLSDRLSLGLLFRVDLLFTMILVAAALYLVFLGFKKTAKPTRKAPSYAPQRRRTCHWGIGLAAGYLSLSLGLQMLATAGFNADLRRRAAGHGKIIVAPGRSHLFFWRAVAAREDEFWVGYRSVFESPSSPVRWTVYPQNKAVLAMLDDRFEMRTLFRMTGGWWLARANSKGAWLGDLRQPEARNWGDKKGMVDSRLACSWLFNAESQSDGLRLMDESSRNSYEMLRRTFSRILGNRAEWEANPRLAGVPGSLPEFLPAEE